MVYLSLTNLKNSLMSNPTARNCFPTSHTAADKMSSTFLISHQAATCNRARTKAERSLWCITSQSCYHRTAWPVTRLLNPFPPPPPPSAQEWPLHRYVLQSPNAFIRFYPLVRVQLCWHLDSRTESDSSGLVTDSTLTFLFLTFCKRVKSRLHMQILICETCLPLLLTAVPS